MCCCTECLEDSPPCDATGTERCHDVWHAGQPYKCECKPEYHQVHCDKLKSESVCCNKYKLNVHFKSTDFCCGVNAYYYLPINGHQFTDPPHVKNRSFKFAENNLLRYSAKGKFYAVFFTGDKL